MAHDNIVAVNFFRCLPAFFIAFAAHEHAVYKISSAAAKSMEPPAGNSPAYIITILLSLFSVMIIRTLFAPGAKKTVPVNLLNYHGERHENYSRSITRAQLSDFYQS